MVQTDISQLSKECTQWREQLHSWRDEFNATLKQQLPTTARKHLTREELTELEHFQNLLQIQLFNIHDLKQAVKANNKRIQYEIIMNNGQLSNYTLENHEQLQDEYQTLDNRLREVRTDLGFFVSALS
jgi:hypothetical protein